MTVDAARLARLAQQERALTAVFARFAGILENLDTPLKALLSLSDELTEVYVRAERGYAVAFATGDQAITALARQDYQLVLDAAAKFTPSEAAEVERLLADRIQLLAGGPEALAARAEQLAGTAEERAIRRALRVANRWAKRDLLGAATKLEEALLRTVSAVESSPVQDAVLQYVRTVRPNDHLAWRAIAQKIAAQGKLEQKLNVIRAAGGAEAFGEAELRTLLASEGGAVQGALGEVWTWRSRPWLLRERQLVRTGLERGRRLAFGAQEFRPLVVREPLRVAGKEIYDGSVLLTRPLASGPNVQVFDAYLHSTLQVQVRERVSLLDIAARDIERELQRPGGLVMRTVDHTQTFIVRSAPDGLAPTRYIVAPELDAALSPVVPAGAQIVHIPTVLSRDQFSDIAFLFLKSLL
jgi:plasmid stabilization system protein ParE